MSDVLFDDCETMSNHIISRHCEEPGVLNTICPLCSEPVEGPVASAALHLTRHMEDIALGILPRGEDFEHESDVSYRSGETDRSVSEAEEEELPIQECSSLNPRSDFAETADQIYQAFAPDPKLQLDPLPKDKTTMPSALQTRSQIAPNSLLPCKYHQKTCTTFTDIYTADGHEVVNAQSDNRPKTVEAQPTIISPPEQRKYDFKYTKQI